MFINGSKLKIQSLTYLPLVNTVEKENFPKPLRKPEFYIDCHKTVQSCKEVSFEIKERKILAQPPK